MKLPTWTDDVGRIVGGLLLTILLIALGVSVGKAWLGSVILGLCVEGIYWTVIRHKGVTYDKVFDFHAWQFGLVLCLLLLGNLVAALVILYFLVLIAALTWDFRSPGGTMAGKYLKQWGVEEPEE
jgi:hypothetical protein